jgi:hypothetical protein
MMKTAAFVAALLLVIGGITLAAVADDPPAGDPRIKAILEELGLKYEIDDDGDYKVLLEWEEDGRSQLAFINSATERLEKMEVREIWSAGYTSEKPLKAKIANRLLEDSFQKKLGSWQLMKGDIWIATFAVKLDADADADTVWTALEAVLTSADEMEKELLGTDDL